VYIHLQEVNWICTCLTTWMIWHCLLSWRKYYSWLLMR